jgi:hypothetical protein
MWAVGFLAPGKAGWKDTASNGAGTVRTMVMIGAIGFPDGADTFLKVDSDVCLTQIST